MGDPQLAPVMVVAELGDPPGGQPSHRVIRLHSECSGLNPRSGRGSAGNRLLPSRATGTVPDYRTEMCTNAEETVDTPAPGLQP